MILFLQAISKPELTFVQMLDLIESTFPVTSPTYTYITGNEKTGQVFIYMPKQIELDPFQREWLSNSDFSGRYMDADRVYIEKTAMSDAERQRLQRHLTDLATVSKTLYSLYLDLAHPYPGLGRDRLMMETLQGLMTATQNGAALAEYIHYGSDEQWKE